MKKTILMALVALAFQTNAFAQSDLNIFNHLAVGVNAGTAGVGLDVAMPACQFVQIRAGFDAMPKFKVNTHLDLNASQYLNAAGITEYTHLDRIDVQGKPNLVNGKVLIDILPFIVNGFRVTVGAYFGAGDVVNVYNREDGVLNKINQANGKIESYNNLHPSTPQKLIGLELGDYLLTPDAQGNVKANINTKTFRPYVGIGYGRAVPKHRVGCSIDLGCMFWGKPTVDCNGVELTSENLGSNGGDIIKTISKIKVYPCLTLRLCGRIF